MYCFCVRWVCWWGICGICSLSHGWASSEAHFFVVVFPKVDSDIHVDIMHSPLLLLPPSPPHGIFLFFFLHFLFFSYFHIENQEPKRSRLRRKMTFSKAFSCVFSSLYIFYSSFFGGGPCIEGVVCFSFWFFFLFPCGLVFDQILTLFLLECGGGGGCEGF